MAVFYTVVYLQFRCQYLASHMKILFWRLFYLYNILDLLFSFFFLCILAMCEFLLPSSDILSAVLLVCLWIHSAPVV